MVNCLFSAFLGIFCVPVLTVIKKMEFYYKKHTHMVSFGIIQRAQRKRYFPWENMNQWTFALSRIWDKYLRKKKLTIREHCLGCHNVWFLRCILLQQRMKVHVVRLRSSTRRISGNQLDVHSVDGLLLVQIRHFCCLLDSWIRLSEFLWF